jgi:pyrimidine deaminase RibD-like protein
MSHDELKAGQRWVEDAVARILRERGMALTAPVKWTVDSNRKVYLMEVEVNQIRRLSELSYESLEDCPADGAIQKKIEGSLRRDFDLVVEPFAESEAATIEPQGILEAAQALLEDRKFARLAIEEARKSSPEDDRVHPRVGVVIVKDGRVLGVAHRGEIPRCHAEFIAMETKLEHASLSGATIYTTLEPCTSRNHPKIPCAVRLTERKVRRVVIGMLDPDNRVSGRGQRTLRKASITTQLFPADLMAEVEELNRDFIRDRESRENAKRSAFGQVDQERSLHESVVDDKTNASTEGAEPETAKLPSFVFVFGAPLGENDSGEWIMMIKHYGPDTAYNCDVRFFDNDRKNIQRRWIDEHPNSSSLPPDSLGGASQMRFRIPEAGSEGSIDSFLWAPVDPDNQHYTITVSCRDGVFVENWEVTRVDGILRTRITIERGPQWVERHPTLNPVVFACTEPGFTSSPLASVLPEKRVSVSRGWKPNHRFDFPVAIIDPNSNIQVMSGLKLPDGSLKTDFGCWNLLIKHFGDKG